jgi:hypothetical protein
MKNELEPVASNYRINKSQAIARTSSNCSMKNMKEDMKDRLPVNRKGRSVGFVRSVMGVMAHGE